MSCGSEADDINMINEVYTSFTIFARDHQGLWPLHTCLIPLLGSSCLMQIYPAFFPSCIGIFGSESVALAEQFENMACFFFAASCRIASTSWNFIKNMRKWWHNITNLSSSHFWALNILMWHVLLKHQINICKSVRWLCLLFEKKIT